MRHQPHLTGCAFEGFHGGFAVDHRGDDIAVLGDVLLTLVPLVIAGVVTLELCVVFGIPPEAKDKVLPLLDKGAALMREA